MGTGKNRRTALSWLVVAGLFMLCGVLGALQYRWIGEVSVAARDRLRGSLQASLNRLSLDFNTEIATACRALLPADSGPGSAAAEAGVLARYAQWKKTARRGQMFRHIALAEPRNKTAVLRILDLDRGVFETAEWPQGWIPFKERLENMLSAEGRERRGFPGPPPDEQGTLFDIPALGISAPGRSPDQFARGEAPSLLFDLNPEYVRDVLLPELLQRHLETGGTLEYQVEVLSRQRPPVVIYQSDPGAQVAASADASVGLFDTPYDQIFRGSPGRGGRGRGPGRGGPGSDSGRWQMFVRHRAGSLEAVVARARWLNLAVTAGVLLLMMASVGALITYTRRAQKLADLQMDFVAGISHELRTPLTVIHTAAYNLRGKLAANPAQVEKYGVLIQQESGRLKDLVEQVLRFSGATAGRVIQNPEPLSIRTCWKPPWNRPGRSSRRPDASSRSTSIRTFPSSWETPWRSNRRCKTCCTMRPDMAPATIIGWASRHRDQATAPGRRWKSAWPTAAPESRPMSRRTSSNPSFAGAARSRTRYTAPGWG
jgi:hypothetical protein